MDNHSYVWVNSKIILITRWDLNILLLQAKPLKFLWALNLLIIVNAKLSANECKTSAKEKKKQKQKTEARVKATFTVFTELTD